MNGRKLRRVLRVTPRLPVCADYGFLRRYFPVQFSRLFSYKIIINAQVKAVALANIGQNKSHSPIRFFLSNAPAAGFP
jgi:hypothetical protein